MLYSGVGGFSPALCGSFLERQHDRNRTLGEDFNIVNLARQNLVGDCIVRIAVELRNLRVDGLFDNNSPIVINSFQKRLYRHFLHLHSRQ